MVAFKLYFESITDINNLTIMGEKIRVKSIEFDQLLYETIMMSVKVFA